MKSGRSSRITALPVTGPTTRSERPACGSTRVRGPLASRKAANRLIVPGEPDESELVFRIESDDAELLMPPNKSGKPLSWPDQVAVLQAVGPRGRPLVNSLGLGVRPRSPRCRLSGTPAWADQRRSIGSFVAGLESEGLALRHAWPPGRRLIRRVTLDLTGLAARRPRRLTRSSPIPSPEAYERIVDRLAATRPGSASTWPARFGSMPPGTATPSGCTSSDGEREVMWP